ncbi:hypothetical protein B0H14DRAFT_263764 [Mycena olivaceomarginata]|nr:hypothetical protein B0H14DRAFT_263764 [Mycena olivaceomarginata]
MGSSALPHRSRPQEPPRSCSSPPRAHPTPLLPRPRLRARTRRCAGRERAPIYVQRTSPTSPQNSGRTPMMSSWTGSLSLTSSRWMMSFLSARSPSPPSAAPHLPSRTASPPPHPPRPCSTLTRTTPHRAGQYLADPRRYPARPHVPRAPLAPMQCPRRVRDVPNSGHELPRVSALLCRLVLPRVPPAERRAPCLPRCSHSQALALAPGHRHIRNPRSY